LRRLALLALFASLAVSAAHAQQGFSRTYSDPTVSPWSRNVEEIPTRRGAAARLAIHTIEEIGGCWASDLGGDATLLGEHRIVNSRGVLNAWIDACEGRTPSLNSLLFDLHYGPKESLTGCKGSCNCVVNSAVQICDQSRWSNSISTFKGTSSSTRKRIYNQANGIVIVERDYFCLFRLQASKSRRIHIRRRLIHTYSSRFRGRDWR
jgi:hypothetical protein